MLTIYLFSYIYVVGKVFRNLTSVGHDCFVLRFATSLSRSSFLRTVHFHSGGPSTFDLTPQSGPIWLGQSFQQNPFDCLI